MAFGEATASCVGTALMKMDTPLRILLTADPELPVPPVLYGGIERVVADLVAELRARGHGVGLVAHPESTARVDALYPWPGAVSQRALDTLANARALRRAVR